MKKIGFIDYYLDEWHAEKFPEWIWQVSDGKMKVAYAYGKIDAPQGETNQAWCERKGIQLCNSIEEVVEKSDYLIVLSPDHAEQHEELSKIPLQSGKRTYIDKTFAPDRDTALRIFAAADAGKTPIFSTSSLRFAAEYADLPKELIDSIYSFGPGQFETYSVHQFEPIVSLMGPNIRRVMSIGTEQTTALLIQYEDGRQATIHHLAGDQPFQMLVQGKESYRIRVESNFFQLFIHQLIRFFETGKSPVQAEETIAVMTLIEYGRKAMESPFTWIDLPSVRR